MDEIDNVVDNLFNQYIPKKKDVAPIPSEPPPSAAPEPDPELDATASIPAAAHPDIVQKPSEPHPDIVKKTKSPPAKPKAAVKAAVKAQKVAAAKKSAKKKTTAPVSVPVNIAKIKKQTARMLRHLHKAIKSENWWHKLYYANKFLLLAVTISKTITKREKKN
jgi:hypothetical protein